MGRKQNPLIVEFFVRGEKLDNASNRYKHTCKSCHQEYPKGRVDALLLHLTRCVAINSEERQRILHELSEKPGSDGGPNKFALELQQQQEDPSPIFTDAISPVGLLRDDSQVLDPSLDDGQGGRRKRRRGDDSKVNLDQKQYECTFQLSTTGSISQSAPPIQQRRKEETVTSTPVMGHMTEDERTMMQGIKQFTDGQADGERGTYQPAQDTTHHAEYESARQDVYPNLDASMTGGLTSDQLALAASVANGMMADSNEQSNTSGLLDTTAPNLSSQDNSVIDPLLGGDQQLTPVAKSPKQRQEVVFHHVRPGRDPKQPHAPYMHDFSIYSDGKNNRIRNKFTENRRKEVQEVRKQGACIRCRMLKKPCSEDSPCSTCRSVDAARLWKTPCLRARIADVFDLLRDNIHLLMHLKEMKVVNEPMLYQETASMIEVTQFPGSPLAPTILHSVRRQTSAMLTGQISNPIASRNAAEPPTEVELLHFSSSNIAEDLGQYLDHADRTYCELEPSHFMRETLLVALDTLDQKPDPLLKSAISLWTTTRCLADSQVLWHIRSITRDNIDGLNNASDPSFSTEISQDNNPLSYRLISGQLLEFTEKRACKLCRTLMHDFERRLIQRQKVHQQQFETFLAAIILMSSLEKLCWLFNTWAVKESEIEDAQEQEQVYDLEKNQTPIATDRGVWPISKSPRQFVETGERVADIVAMLMKMRELPPPMAVDQDGYLCADLTKKPPKGARYDGAAGYKTSPKTSVPSVEGRTDLDAFLGIDSSRDQLRGDEEGQDDKVDDDMDQMDFGPQVPFDEHQASLIAQLHRDLQANNLLQSGGETSPSPDSPIQDQILPQSQPFLAIDSPQQPDLNVADAVEDAMDIDHSDEQLQFASAEQEVIPDKNDDASLAGLHISAETQGSAETPLPMPEDPLMAHLQQAAAEAAQAVTNGGFPFDTEDQKDKEDDDSEATQTPPVILWFDRVKLKVEDLIRARQNPPWDDHDCHCWELKYISRMLLPEIPGDS